MENIFFVCPHCGTHSRFMSVITDKKYTPTLDDKMMYKKYPVFEYIGDEILLCKCNKELTWFDMQGVTTNAN